MPARPPIRARALRQRQQALRRIARHTLVARSERWAAVLSAADLPMADLGRPAAAWVVPPVDWVAPAAPLSAFPLSMEEAAGSVGEAAPPALAPGASATVPPLPSVYSAASAVPLGPVAPAGAAPSPPTFSLSAPHAAVAAEAAVPRPELRQPAAAPAAENSAPAAEGAIPAPAAESSAPAAESAIPAPAAESSAPAAESAIPAPPALPSSASRPAGAGRPPTGQPRPRLRIEELGIVSSVASREPTEDQKAAADLPAQTFPSPPDAAEPSGDPVAPAEAEPLGPHTRSVPLARPPAVDSTELFAAGDADRSPAAWLSRLTSPAPAPSAPPEIAARTPGQPPATPGQPPAASEAPPLPRTVRPVIPGPPPGPGSARPPAQTSVAQPPRGRVIEAESPVAGPPSPADSAELFAAGTADHSPAAWAARLIAPTTAPSELTASPMLVGPPTAELSAVVPALEVAWASAYPAAALAPLPSPAHMGEAPTPLSDSARRFLQPLVGIDPATVPIFRGPVAAAAASAMHADALSTSGAVLIGTANPPESPRDLGLVAHELAHVARERESRFVPPVLGGPPADTGSPPAPNVPIGNLPATDEEELALSVEQQVTRAANAWVRRHTTPSGPPPTTPIAPASAIRPDTLPEPAAPAVQPSVLDPTPRIESVAEPDGVTNSFQPTPPAEPRHEQSAWGGLPAPWEPLPDWVSAALESTSPSSAPSAAPARPAAAESGAAVQLAEQGRALESEAEPGTSAPPPQGNAANEPNLDILARQVYRVLRRRLASERRRLR